MLFDDWYQDELTIYRNVQKSEGFEDIQVREIVAEKVPCRMYEKSLGGLTTKQGGAEAQSELKMAVDIDTDIKEGDEAYIIRQGETESRRYLVGNIKRYAMPLGMYDVGLDHLEVALTLRQEA